MTDKQIKIAICGNMGAGKDLAFTILKSILFLGKTQNVFSNEFLLHKSQTDEMWLNDQCHFVIERFARPIKECIAGFTGMNIAKLQSQEVKQQILPDCYFSNTLSEITVRQLHQIIADGLKNVLNPDIFALSLINRISKPDFQNSNIAVVDLRFVNEAAVLQQNGFTIIKIINHNNTKPIMAHNSEQEQVSIEPDYVLHNDGISIPNLQVAIYDMCKYFNWVD